MLAGVGKIITLLLKALILFPIDKAAIYLDKTNFLNSNLVICYQIDKGITGFKQLLDTILRRQIWRLLGTNCFPESFKWPNGHT